MYIYIPHTYIFAMLRCVKWTYACVNQVFHGNRSNRAHSYSHTVSVRDRERESTCCFCWAGRPDNEEWWGVRFQLKSHMLETPELMFQCKSEGSKGSMSQLCVNLSVLFSFSIDKMRLIFIRGEKSALLNLLIQMFFCRHTRVMFDQRYGDPWPSQIEM
jgi:hypothetical protein